MALIGKTTTQIGQLLPDGYHKIEQEGARFSGGNLVVAVATYASLAAYEAGLPLVERNVYALQVDLSQPVLEQSYGALKALPEFNGCVDHLEPVSVQYPSSPERAALLAFRNRPLSEIMAEEAKV